jgi:hypothetical protein
MPVAKMQRRWVVESEFLLVAGQLATPAWTWGRLGHRVISRLAEKNLAPAAKAAVADLLPPGQSLADASMRYGQLTPLSGGVTYLGTFVPRNVTEAAMPPKLIAY